MLSESQLKESEPVGTDWETQRAHFKKTLYMGLEEAEPFAERFLTGDWEGFPTSGTGYYINPERTVLFGPNRHGSGWTYFAAWVPGQNHVLIHQSLEGKTTITDGWANGIVVALITSCKTHRVAYTLVRDLDQTLVDETALRMNTLGL